MLNIQLTEFIQQHQLQVKRIVLALSGGLDSMVLLALLAQQRDSLPLIHAVHVNHQLQDEASQWAIICQQQCQQLDIPLSVFTVTVDSSGEGIEAAARKARYQALADFMQAGDLLVTAHHADDQAETLLLQLFRGAGIDGTASMPVLKTFARGLHGRPLLKVTRAQLQQFAEQHSLQWIEDPSNQDTHFDRNFLRQAILPQLQTRWPSLTQTLARVAQNHAETRQVLNRYLDADLESWLETDGRLRWPGLAELESARQAQLLRHWIKQQGYLPPSRKVLERIQVEMFTPRDDATPLVEWGESCIRRYRDYLYLEPRMLEFDHQQCIEWDTQQTLAIAGAGELQMVAVEAGGLPATWAEKKWQVRFRQGGETVQRAGQECHLQLKKLLQDAAMPPWLRERLPLLYCDDELVFIPGVFQKQRLADGEPGILPVWRPLSTAN